MIVSVSSLSSSGMSWMIQSMRQQYSSVTSPTSWFSPVNERPAFRSSIRNNLISRYYENSQI